MEIEYPELFKIKYRIIDVNESEQTITVRYWTDFLSEEDLAYDANRNPDGTPVRCRTDYNFSLWDMYKTEEDIEALIVNSIPIDWFKLQYKVKSPQIDNTINGTMACVKNLINKTFEKDITLKVEQPPEENTDINSNNSDTVLNDLVQKMQKVSTLSENELDELLELLVEK
jgi:hypothetical protein